MGLAIIQNYGVHQNKKIRKKLNFQKPVVMRVASLLLNPQTLKYVPLPVGCHVFIQKENGELRLFQFLESCVPAYAPEKNNFFSLYMFQIHD